MGRINKAYCLQSIIRQCLFGLFSLGMLVISSASWSEVNSTTHQMVFATKPRSYGLFVPEGLDTTPKPVVFVLHGGMGNGRHAQQITGMSKLAKQQGFIAVYPDGAQAKAGIMRRMKTWNAGECCGAAVKQGSDDVGFLKAVIEDIARQHMIDRKRIYFTGHSNGAMMAYRVACEAPEMVAAIVPISGTLALSDCRAGQPVPVLHIHGTGDNNVPLDGGKGKRSIAGVEHRSVWETLRLLSKKRDCKPPMIQRTATGKMYSYQCNNGAPFFLQLIEGGGHPWPGSNRDKFHSGVSGSQAAWEFLQHYSK